MNKKILLPIFAACAMLGGFTACSDSGSDAPDSIVDPSVPSETPVDPTTPADPTVPEDPSIPADVPSDPQVPADPSVPVDPTVPADPSVPTEGPTDVILDPTLAGDSMKVVIENTFPNNESVGQYDATTYDYFGAELSGTDQFTYGRFEARMKMVSIPGSVSSMFLYYDNSWMYGDEPWNEIDIEVLGTNPGSWQSNLITRDPNVVGTSKKQTTSEFKTGFGFNSTEDFHLYAMIWTPEYISWEIDSVEVRRDVIGMAKGQVEFMTLQQSLRFNLWASKSANWVGKFTGEELAEGPKEQAIDYVRVYKYDVATKTFTLDWQDDFDGDALDKKHWNTGNWEMERVMLNDDNVVVEDGFCKLRLSRVAK